MGFDFGFETRIGDGFGRIDCRLMLGMSVIMDFEVFDCKKKSDFADLGRHCLAGNTQPETGGEDGEIVGWGWVYEILQQWPLDFVFDSF